MSGNFCGVCPIKKPGDREIRHSLCDIVQCGNICTVGSRTVKLRNSLENLTDFEFFYT